MGWGGSQKLDQSRIKKYKKEKAELDRLLEGYEEAKELKEEEKGVENERITEIIEDNKKEIEEIKRQRKQDKGNYQFKFQND